jgi:hypothetical protein
MMRKLAAAGSGPVNLGQVVPWRTGSVKGGAIPIKRGVRDRWADTSKYTADNLPAIRKRKGVGRPIDKPARVRLLGHITVYPALLASHWGRPSPNLAEWHRKPRRKDRAAA